MTQTTTIISRSVFGNKRVVIGTLVDTDSSGNTYNNSTTKLDTGLNTIDFIGITRLKTAIDGSGNRCDVSGNFPTSDGKVLLLYDVSGNILFEAIGR